MRTLITAVVAVALLLVALDLWHGPRRRRGLCERHRHGWRRLRATRPAAFARAYLRAQRRSLQWLLDPGALYRRSLPRTLLAALALTALSFTVWWCLRVCGDRDALLAALEHYAAPTFAGAWLALLLSAAALRYAGADATPLRKLAALLPVPVVLALLWLALMHVATWSDWRERRSPVGYASELFYAEVYLELFREPAGQMLSAASATALAAPVVVAFAAFVGAMLLRLSAPLGEALASPVMRWLEATRRGIPTLTVAAVVAVVLIAARLA